MAITISGSVVLSALAFILFNALLGGLMVEYVANYWLSRYKGRPIQAPFLPCMIAGLILWQFTIIATLITWIISYAD